MNERLLGGVQRARERVKLGERNLGRQWTPAVAVAKQHKEVGPWRDALAARDLVEADGHRALVESRLLAHSPAQIDGLKACAPAGAQRAQSGKHLFLQGVALRLEVAKR